MKKVALYARVSTSDQNCELQLRELREYVARQGWTMADIEKPEGWTPHVFQHRKEDEANEANEEGLCRICKRGVQHALHTGLFAEYVDTGESGAKVSRPELDRLTADAHTRKIDCVLVSKLDRWGRSLLHCLDSIQELVRLKIRWLAVTQNLDTDENNPMSRLLLNILAVFAQFEREMTRERTGGGFRKYRADHRKGIVGIVRHSRTGKDLPVGRPKKTYRNDPDGRPRGADAIRKMQAKGMSCRAIAKELKVSDRTVRRAIANG